NNVVFDNSSQGILLNSANGAQVVNNTVYQPAGDGGAVKVNGSSRNVSLRNNILWVAGSAYDLEVASDSQVGFASDYNLLYVTGSGQVGLWQGVPRPTLTAWQTADFTDQNSLSQDPLFLNTAGPDDSLDFHEQ